jgi:hypothetical protein
MKKNLLSPAIFLLIIFSLPAPATAAGLCCIENRGDRVINCQPALGNACPTATAPIDCALENMCSAYAQDAAAAPARCCIIPYNQQTCAPLIGACSPQTLEVLCSAVETCKEFDTAAAPAATTKKDVVKILTPKLSINIPTLNMPEFLNVTSDGDNYYIPFISVYLAAMFKLGVGAAAVLAVIMIMIGGFIWIAAGGDAGKISKAKAMIKNAVVGLILSLGSFIFLQTVNPDLVNLRGLKIPIVRENILEIVEDYHPETEIAGAPAAPLAPSDYDAIFAKYAPCAGVEPNVLKAIAMVESGMKPDKVNASGYVGLFQTKQANCPSNVAKYCSDLKNPENNTAAASAMIKKSVDLIIKNCPKARPYDQMVMIYIGHNMGNGMLNYVTQKGCNVSAMREATIEYYTKYPKTANAYAPKYQPSCLNGRTDVRAMAECTGGPKFDYAIKTANRAGVDRVIPERQTGVCPY